MEGSLELARRGGAMAGRRTQAPSCGQGAARRSAARLGTKRTGRSRAREGVHTERSQCARVAARTLGAPGLGLLDTSDRTGGGAAETRPTLHVGGPLAAGGAGLPQLGRRGVR